jgi:hypothetical protein
MGLSTPPLTHADSLKAKYAGKGWTTDRLKKVLKANHQPFKTLNKTALIACCVDIELKGALPQCPKCSDTLPDGCKPPLLIAASPSGYRCEGYLDAKKDDHIDCSAGGKLTDAQVREPPRAVRLESARERERESGAGGLTREVERPLPSNTTPECDEVMPFQLNTVKVTEVGSGLCGQVVRDTFKDIFDPTDHFQKKRKAGITDAPSGSTPKKARAAA